MKKLLAVVGALAALTPYAVAQTTSTMPDHDPNAQGSATQVDLSDANSGSSNVFVEVKPKAGATDGTFTARKMDSDGNWVGDPRSIGPGSEFTFILGPGEKVVGWDDDSVTDDTASASGSILTR